MPTTENKVLSAVIKNKDIHTLLTAPHEIFAGYENVVDTYKTYYQKYRTVPTVEAVQREHVDFQYIDTNEPTSYYIDALRDEYLDGRMQQLLMKAASVRDEMAPAQALQKLTEAVAKLSQFTTTSKDLNLKDTDFAKDHFMRQAEKAKLNNGTPGIPTGFKALDSVYPTGFAPGHSVTLFGRTGRGKSLIAALMACKAYTQGYKPMIVSLEMSPSEQLERIYTILASGIFTMSGMARGEVNLDEFDKWADKSLKQDFIIVSNEGMTDITPSIIDGKIQQHQPDIVFLDYLQLMMDNSRNGGMTPRMLSLSREIKMLAMSRQIPIVSISGVTERDSDDISQPPTLDAVSWSAGIKFDSNLAIAVQKAEKSEVIEMVVRKNRHGDHAAVVVEAKINEGIFAERWTL